MAVHTGLLRITTSDELDVVDITEGVAQVVRTSGVATGSVTVFVTGSTAAITTMEYEPGGVQDLRDVLERLVPSGGDYAHNRLNADDNAHSHLRASLLGPSLSIPLIDGHLALGTWQQVVLINLDDRGRERTVSVQIIS